MRRLLPILLLLAAPLVAQDEELAPDASDESISNSCAASTAWSTLDDGVPENASADWCVSSTCAATPTSDTSWKVLFPTPTNPPSADTDGQTLAAWVRSCQSGGTSSTCRLDLYCNNTLQETGGTEHTISSSTGQEITEAVSFGGACASDGSDVEIRLVCTASGGTPSGRRIGDAGAVEWRVTWAVAGSRRVMVVSDGREYDEVLGGRLVAEGE